MVDTQDYIGQQISEYALQRQLGRGTFGAVYLAEQIHDKNLVAIKLLRMQLTRTLELKDFLNEARVMRLRHPHIIPILDFGIGPQDIPFIVMEYAAGGSMRDRFWHGASLPLPEIVTYTNQVASALQYAHSRRLIHRDVKPENILLSADSTIRLCDFGIAKIMEQSSTMSIHALAGTPAYMAPEQGQGAPCPASDQYALGIVVYEWLTGRRPFLGTPIEIAVQHRLHEPPPLRLLRPDLPTEAEQVVLKALAKKPEERFETVIQFAEALQNAIDGSPTEKVPAISLEVAPTGRPTSLPESATVMLSRPAQQAPGVVMGQEEAQISDVVAVEELETILERSAAEILENLPTFVVEPASTPQTSAEQERQPPGRVQLRRQLISKRQRLVTALLAFLVVVGCLLGYSAFLFPASPGKQANPSAYDRAIASNGVMFGENAQHTGANPYEHILSTGTIAKLAPAWHIQVGDLLASSPIVANGLIYLSSDSGQLLAFDAASGALKWHVSIGGVTQTTPAVVGNLIYIGSSTGTLFAFDAFTGKFRWSVDLGGSLESSPTFANGLIYLGSSTGTLCAVDARTGKLTWSQPTGEPIITSPAVANGLVYLGSSTGTLSAFDARSGQREWSDAVLDAAFTFSSPVVDAGLIYASLQDQITAQNNMLYAFYASNGLPLWKTNAVSSTLTSPAVANGLVYVGSRDGKISAFDILSHQQVWSQRVSGAITTAPVIANGLVYVGAQTGQIVVFAAHSGQQVWDYSAPTSGELSLTIADGRLYAGSSSGELYAFSLPTL